MTRTRMTRLVLALGLVAAMVAAVAPSAALAAGPAHQKLAPGTQSFDAGVLCDFAVTWDLKGTNDNELDFPVQANGDQLIRLTGRELLTVTNVDSGASVLLRGGYREDVLFHADGSIDVTINGTIVAGYFPTDLGGPAMWWFKGHLQDGLDSTFTTLSHAFVGNATDLCSALS